MLLKSLIHPGPINREAFFIFVNYYFVFFSAFICTKLKLHNKFSNRGLLPMNELLSKKSCLSSVLQFFPLPWIFSVDFCSKGYRFTSLQLHAL